MGKLKLTIGWNETAIQTAAMVQNGKPCRVHGNAAAELYFFTVKLTSSLASNSVL